jgi:nucleotide-binding universal stress UspA family protein
VCQPPVEIRELSRLRPVIQAKASLARSNWRRGYYSSDLLQACADFAGAILEHGHQPGLILTEVRELPMDVIVMSKHERSAFDCCLLDSIPRHVFSDARCDVLIVPGIGQAP